MASNPFNTGAQLGEMIFGQPDDGQAYAKGLYTGARANNSMQQARRNRALALIAEDRNQARQGINPEALGSAGYGDDAALVQSILRANKHVQLGDLGALERPGADEALQQARDAMQLGDIAGMNAPLAYVKGDPLETTDVQQGVALNPYAASGQDLQATPLGEASIALDQARAASEHAQAGAYNASANQRNAHAGLYDTQAGAGGWNPNTGSHNTLPSVSKIESILPPASADPASDTYLADKAQAAADRANDVQGVQQWLAQHRAATLRDYVGHGPVGAPGTVAPAGTMPISPELQTALDNRGEQGLGDMMPAATVTPIDAGPAQPVASGTPTAINPKTGEKLVWNGSQWVPANG